MMLLLTRTHPEIERLRGEIGPGIGRLVTPRQESSIERTAEAGIVWAADNDAFAAWSDARFKRLVSRIRDLPGRVFVAAPDVVGDARATLRRFARWRDYLPAPVAFVAQDGLERLVVPWDELDALFIGGTTDWKLGPAAAELAVEAKQRGLWLHVGRVNSAQRARYARALGADSIDGTKLSRFPNTYAHQARAWLAEPHQLLLGRER